MRKTNYSPKISDILGLSLIFSMLLYFCMSGLAGIFGMSEGALALKLLLKLPIFLLPILFVLIVYKRFSLTLPCLDHPLNYNESAMLTVSSFGGIVLMQVLYGSVFPSTFGSVGISQTSSIGGFMLLFCGSVVVPAILEELFFRGIILRALTAYRALLAILISSLAYALMHFSLEGFPIYFFCGFMIGSVYYATGSLGAAIGIQLLASATRFLAETVNVYALDRYELFLRILIASCVLLFAFGLPFLRKTVRALLADEHDDSTFPSSQFWGVPIIVFLMTAVSVQLIFGTV